MENVEFTQYAMAAFVIIGIVNITQLALEGEWKSFAKAIIAVIAATFFGFMNWFGLSTMEIGLAVGISSSGVYKLGQVLSGR